MEENETDAPTENRARGSDRRAEPITVLLTDDDADLRETQRYWLAEGRRWVTREASNGEEALTKLDENVDVLVLDQRMQGVSGPEVIARLDETTFDGDVVLVSADGLDARVDETDIAAYLPKPVQRETFVDALGRCRPK